MWPLHASYGLTVPYSAAFVFAVPFMAVFLGQKVSWTHPFRSRALCSVPSSPHMPAHARTVRQRWSRECYTDAGGLWAGAACSLIPSVFSPRKMTTQRCHRFVEKDLTWIQRSLEFCQYHVIPNKTYRFLRWARTKLCESIQQLSTGWSWNSVRLRLGSWREQAVPCLTWSHLSQIFHTTLF